MVICLERDADLHMEQLMPLPLIVSCFSIRYDTRCYFNVLSKADISQLNLPHGLIHIQFRFVLPFWYGCVCHYNWPRQMVVFRRSSINEYIMYLNVT